MLCLPLEHARRLAGLIYLENNRAAGMFTPDRTEVLRLLDAALATELVCVLRYRRHHFMARGIHARGVADAILEGRSQVISEMVAPTTEDFVEVEEAEKQ